jgi:peptidyl-prolyl cis-trans isomerase C
MVLFSFTGEPKMNSRRYLYWGMVWIAVFMIIGCNEVSKNKPVVGVDQQVVARVNGSPISQHKLDRFVMAMKQGSPHAKESESPEAELAVKKEALKNLIQLELLYQDCQAKNLTANDEEVDQVVDNLKSQFPNAEMFQQLLADSYSSEDDLRDDIRRKLSVEKLLDQEILPQVEVTEEESSAFYEEHKQNFERPEGVQVSHILVRLDKDASPEDEASAKQKIEDIKTRIDNGEDFAELARANSDCPSSQKGGDLGVIVRGQTVPEFEETAFGLEEPEQVSQVIKTSYGFHILKLGQKKPAGTMPYEEVREAINRQLKNQILGKKMQAYVQELRAKAEIESELELDETPAE